MRFGRVDLHEAEGAILAHTLHVGDAVFKKGRVLDAADLATLRAAGHDAVVAARLEPGDVREDAAAERVATAGQGAGVRIGAAFTGRANLYAEVRGVLVVERGRVDALNEVDEGITLATAEPCSVVGAGQMVATVKIIPFAVPETAVQRCSTLAGVGGGLVQVAPLRPHAVGLVLTRLPGTRESVVDKAAGVFHDRVQGLGSVLAEQVRCAHETGAIADAVAHLREAGCAPIVVFGASAVVDRGDVVPAAIERIGGTIEHFGMPVDPGNLLLLGRLGDTVVIGAPGCARSPRPSGFDDVLQRVLAGIEVTRRDLQAMGAGGLLKEIRSRPQPRGADAAGEGRRVVDAIVLAAGRSARMGAQNKLLVELQGQAMVARVVASLRASRVRDVVVVTGHDADRVADPLADSGARVVHNPDHAAGMSTSLRAGLDALRPGVDGVLVALGDMPLVGPTHVDALLEAFDPLEGRSVVVPTHGDKRGNPVLWARRYFDEMRALTGDVGARRLIRAHADQVHEVPLDDDAVLVDVDTPTALNALRDRPS